MLSRRSILASLTTSPMAPTAMAAERSSADGKLVTLGLQFDALAAQIDQFLVYIVVFSGVVPGNGTAAILLGGEKVFNEFWSPKLAKTRRWQISPKEFL